MAVLFSNNASTTLASGITDAATSIVLATGTGALFPSVAAPDFFYATIYNASNNIEIVRVTARASDTLTVVRAQEGTTARAFLAGDRVDLRVTAAGLANKLDKDTGGTVAGRLVTTASTTSAAGLNLPPGTAPNTPVNGDLWTTASGLLGRINGATVQFSFSSAVETLTGKTLNLTNNTLVATVAQINGAVSDGDFVTTTGSETISSKTITGSTCTGSILSSTADATILNGNCVVTDTGGVTAVSPGFRGLPLLSRTSTYALSLNDAGKMVSITAGGVAIPANSGTAFPVGTTIVIFNDSGSSQTVTITTDTLRLAGTASTGTRTMAGYALATLVKVATTTWVISGAGVS